jgi:hypothetical protein
MSQNTTTNRSNGSQDAKRPVITFGPYPLDKAANVKVAVWDNQVNVNGKDVTFYSCTVQRSYKDDQGWHESKGFRHNDIPVLIHALTKAYDWILEERNNRVPA